MFFGYNALSVEEQTDVAGFSVLLSLKVFSPEIMQILLEIDWQPCHTTSEDFPPAVDSWPVAFETRGVFTKRKKPSGKIMYLIKNILTTATMPFFHQRWLFSNPVKCECNPPKYLQVPYFVTYVTEHTG